MVQNTVSLLASLTFGPYGPTTLSRGGPDIHEDDIRFITAFMSYVSQHTTVKKGFLFAVVCFEGWLLVWLACFVFETGSPIAQAANLELIR